jgi:hypothetical protein
MTFMFENQNADRISDFELKLMDIDSEHLGIPGAPPQETHPRRTARSREAADKSARARPPAAPAAALHAPPRPRGRVPARPPPFLHAGAAAHFAALE